jgi:hypothetical protein
LHVEDTDYLGEFYNLDEGDYSSHIKIKLSFLREIKALQYSSIRLFGLSFLKEIYTL